MLTVEQTDLSVPGRGLNLELTRVYVEPYSFLLGAAPSIDATSGTPTECQSCSTLSSNSGGFGEHDLLNTGLNDLIVIWFGAKCLGCSIPSVLSVVDNNGLTWTRRSFVTRTSGSNNWAEWEYYAFAASALSGEFSTVTLSGNVNVVGMREFAVSGVNPPMPWDNAVNPP